MVKGKGIPEPEWRFKLKTLRDSLLQRCVINFDEVFFDQTGSQLKDIWLPVRLFHDIQLKSIDIGWIIPPDFLKLCLPRRDALNWIDIDLMYGELSENDLLNLANTDCSVRQLSFRTNRLTGPMLNAIAKFGSTLEILEIANTLKYHRLEGPSQPTSLEILVKLPKLKKFVIDLKHHNLFDKFDMTSCSDSLRHLSVIDSDGSLRLDASAAPTFYAFLKTLKCLSNLKTLCLTGEYSYPPILDVLVHLKKLRTLELPSIKGQVLPEHRLGEFLPLFKNLFVPDWMLNKLDLLIDRKLNYIGSKIHPSFRYSEKVGSTYDLQSIINLLEHSTSANGYLEYFKLAEIRRYLCNCPVKTISGMPSLEKIILVYFKWHWIVELEYDGFAFMMETIVYMKMMNYHAWSSEFTMKLANLTVSSVLHDLKMGYNCIRWFEMDNYPDLNKYLFNFMTLNQASSLSKIYLKYLVVSSLRLTRQLFAPPSTFYDDPILSPRLFKKLKKLQLTENFKVTSFEITEKSPRREKRVRVKKS